MPILLNVLGSSDQRVVEQASLCVSRIVESFQYQANRLEELVSVDLLRAILGLLVPGTTNLISANIHTQFLRVLSFAANASPRLAVELFRLDIVETLYQILTGISPPAAGEDIASKLDSVVVMQALIHRPRDQVLETLNVICELLPGIAYQEGLTSSESLVNTSTRNHTRATTRPVTPSSSQSRMQLLSECQTEVRRFAIILFPTLTDAFSSTVNLHVRQRVLKAQLRMLSNLDKDILMDALRMVPYASFLAAILSQDDDLSLSVNALEAAEFLTVRLGDIYRYQFYREGVIAEISRLAAAVHFGHESKVATEPESAGLTSKISRPVAIDPPRKVHDREAQGFSESEEDDDDDDVEDRIEIDNSVDMEDLHEDELGSSSSHGSTASLDGPLSRITGDNHMKRWISARAKRFLEIHESEASNVGLKEKANQILKTITDIAVEVREVYLHKRSCTAKPLFAQLAAYFEGDVLESITSAELLSSNLVGILLEIFNAPDVDVRKQAQSDFLEIFMGDQSSKQPSKVESSTTAFGSLVHKLQDLLSRSEHFEVLTVHSSPSDSGRSAASMLAKQIRLKLVADDDADIPRPYRNIMVSIHAIATFKALDDYLRPRLSLSDRPRTRKMESGLTSALAALAAAGLPTPYSSIAEARARLADRGVGPPPSGEDTQPTPTSQSSGGPRNGSQASTRVPVGSSSDPSTPLNAHEKTSKRQSSRRQPPKDDTPAKGALLGEDDSLANALECADERQLSDDAEDMESNTALDALVDDLEDEMAASSTSEPSAVNMEVASGGKVTARKEDGTRVATPSQMPGTNPRGSGAGQRAPSKPSTPGPTSTGRPMSYAAAIQATPQDWHIEFSLQDKPISLETTIYRAVHDPAISPQDTGNRNAWSAVHAIKYRRVTGPPPPESSSLSFAGHNNEMMPSGIPASLDKHPMTSSILQLLNILHALNANLDDVFGDKEVTSALHREPLNHFVNTKLTSKLNRQLEEPLIVASNCLPPWSEDLARSYPFLFPFETRHLFLQSTSYGYARSMARWQGNQTADELRRERHRDERPFLGRLQRQKVRISRSKILESALKVMELYGASQSILEVEYFEEVGTGLGPTLEFYSTVSREFSKKKLKLWREADGATSQEYAFGKCGLFPAPMSEEQAAHDNGKRILHLFRMLGKFVARSMIDSRIIDVSFNPTFFRIGDDSRAVTPSLGAVKTVDPQLAKSLKLISSFVAAKRSQDISGGNSTHKNTSQPPITVDGVTIEELGLDFTLPGYDIELLPNGSQVSVTIDNVAVYLDKVIDMTLGRGVQRQVDAFRQGFTQVFPYSSLGSFTPDELVMLFGRIEEDWSLESELTRNLSMPSLTRFTALMDALKADHGYNMDSRTIKNLLQTMSEMNIAERREFLQFTTGSPKLPIGGMLTYLPSGAC